MTTLTQKQIDAIQSLEHVAECATLMFIKHMAAGEHGDCLKDIDQLEDAIRRFRAGLLQAFEEG